MTRKCIICGHEVEYVAQIERHLQNHSWRERESALMPEVES